MKQLYLLLPILFWAQSACGQNPAPCACCAPEYHQFDFWIGEWEVFNPKGIKVGENKIIPLQDSCVLQENWVSQQQTGTSYSYYNKNDNTWNQTYIDNQGTVLELKGTFQNGKMVLKSPGIKSKKADFYYFNKITWQPDTAGNVSQIWEIVNASDSVLYTAFNGLYQRKKATPQNGSGKRVTGLGGVFFKSKDPNALKEWYKTHLGFAIDEYGAGFEWRQGADSTLYGFTQWSPFSAKTTYFAPSEKDFMFNYRVADLETLVAELKKEGVTVLDAIEVYDYGKFVHIMDLEGNKIELWEPKDVEYSKILKTRIK